MIHGVVRVVVADTMMIRARTQAAGGDGIRACLPACLPLCIEREREGILPTKRFAKVDRHSTARRVVLRARALARQCHTGSVSK